MKTQYKNKSANSMAQSRIDINRFKPCDPGMVENCVTIFFLQSNGKIAMDGTF